MEVYSILGENLEWDLANFSLCTVCGWIKKTVFGLLIEKETVFRYLLDDGELIAYCSEGLYQPSEIWADDQYIYVGERGGITIFDYDVNVVAQLGFLYVLPNDPWILWRFERNLYIMTLSDALPYSLLKLKRL